MNLWFLEDPIPPENADAFRRLTMESDIPIATGENLYPREGFRPFIEKHACAAIKSCVALESDSLEVPYWQDFIKRSGPVYQDGYLPISDKPGLGIELNEEVCRKYLAEGSSYFK